MSTILSIENYKNPFKILFFGLIILYIVLYMPYGLEDGDMGAIFGISWSMYNGQFPYRDFVYIKPPFSPYFHSLPLYISEQYAYLFNRIFYYIQVFGYSLLLSKLLCNAFDIKRKDVVYFIGIIGALVSIHNYPPMPWNTIDGVFFSVLGLWFLFGRKETVYNLIFAALFVSLGVLCKQSFYFFPVFISLYLGITKQYKKLVPFVGFGILFAGFFLLILYWNGAFRAFFEQMFSFTSGSSLLDTGLKSYYMIIKTNVILVIGFLVIALSVRKLLPSNIAYLIIKLFISVILIYYYTQVTQVDTVDQTIIKVLWVFSVLFTLWKIRYDKRYLFLLLALALGWCASISNGFNTPIDVSVAIVFAIFLFVYATKQITFKANTGLIIIIVFLGTFYYGYQNVYMDSRRSLLTEDMGAVFPQLKFIKSDTETFAKYNEMKILASKYTNYTMMPSMTLGHYLTSSYNPIGVDWVFNHHLSDQLPNYIKRLEDNNVIVFLENDFETSKNKYEETSLLTLYIRDNWQLIATHNYFRIYKKPKASFQLR